MKDQFPGKLNINILGNPNSHQTLMFGHGFGTDQRSFKDVVPFFEKDYRIILYDNAGAGNADISTFNASRYNTLNGYVNDLLEICKFLQLKDIIYVGHSVNGMVGLLASQKMPAYFSKLILLGASPRYLNDASQMYNGGFEQSDLDQLFEAMNNNYFAWASGFSRMVMDNHDRPHLAEHFAGTLKAIRPDIALSVVKAIFQSDHRNDLSKSTIPTLIIQTSSDVAVPESVGMYMHQHIPKSSLVKIETKGHFPQISGPAEIATVIKSFI
ncbi:MAG: alpha/beta hydrolase [Bacteroidota bacterium]